MTRAWRARGSQVGELGQVPECCCCLSLASKRQGLSYGARRTALSKEVGLWWLWAKTFSMLPGSNRRDRRTRSGRVGCRSTDCKRSISQRSSRTSQPTASSRHRTSFCTTLRGQARLWWRAASSRRRHRPHRHALWQMVINSVLFFLLGGSIEHVRVVGGRIHRSMGAISSMHASSA